MIQKNNKRTLSFPAYIEALRQSPKAVREYAYKAGINPKHLLYNYMPRKRFPSAYTMAMLAKHSLYAVAYTDIVDYFYNFSGNYPYKDLPNGQPVPQSIAEHARRVARIERQEREQAKITGGDTNGI